MLLDSNIFWSALISTSGAPHSIYTAWVDARFKILTCPEQIREIRAASRYPKLRNIIQPARIGKMINSLYQATIWEQPLPRNHQSADPSDDYLLNLIDAAQPDDAVTGDRGSGMLALHALGRTRILTARDFCNQVLR